MLLMRRSQAIIHFKAGSPEDAAKKGKHLKHRVAREHFSRSCWAIGLPHGGRDGVGLFPFYHRPALWPWPASQEQMVARPGVKFDLNAEIQNSNRTTIALLTVYPPHMLSPCQDHRRGGGSDIEAFDRFAMCVRKPATFRTCFPALIAHFVFTPCLI